MANPSDDSYALHERLDELPPELWHMIYDLTFTADAKIRLYCRESDAECTNPWSLAMYQGLAKIYPKELVTVNEISHLLHIDRASRNKFAESFYGNPDSLFVVPRRSAAGIKTYLKLVKNLHIGVMWPGGRPNHWWRRDVAEWSERPERSIPFISYDKIVALLKERAGATCEARA